MADLPATIFRRWLHSREEDSPSERVYRTAEFQFRPSRGRTGFEIHPDGTFVAVGIGPADGQRARRGHWRAEHGAIRVRYDDGGDQVLRVVAVDDEVLRIAAN
jgi:hypothetical protein